MIKEINFEDIKRIFYNKKILLIVSNNQLDTKLNDEICNKFTSVSDKLTIETFDNIIDIVKNNLRDQLLIRNHSLLYKIESSSVILIIYQEIDEMTSNTNLLFTVIKARGYNDSVSEFKLNNVYKMIL